MIKSKAQLITAIEEKLGFNFVSGAYYPQYKNTMTKCWTVNIAYQGTQYEIEGDTVNEVYENIQKELL